MCGLCVRTLSGGGERQDWVGQGRRGYDRARQGGKEVIYVCKSALRACVLSMPGKRLEASFSARPSLPSSQASLILISPHLPLYLSFTPLSTSSSLHLFPLSYSVGSSSSFPSSSSLFFFHLFLHTLISTLLPSLSHSVGQFSSSSYLRAPFFTSPLYSYSIFLIYLVHFFSLLFLPSSPLSSHHHFHTSSVFLSFSWLILFPSPLLSVHLHLFSSLLSLSFSWFIFCPSSSFLPLSPNSPSS